MTIIAIDPGISFAYAVCVDGKIKDYGMIETDPKEQLVYRLAEIDLKLKDILKDYQPKKVLLEEQCTTFDRKSHGRTVNRKALQFYSSAWGQINATISQWGVPCEYVRVHKHKLPKKLAQKIACQHLGLKRINHNVAEAITWALGGKA